MLHDVPIATTQVQSCDPSGRVGATFGFADADSLILVRANDRSQADSQSSLAKLPQAIFCGEDSGLKAEAFHAITGWRKMRSPIRLAAHLLTLFRPLPKPPALMRTSAGIAKQRVIAAFTTLVFETREARLMRMRV